jgi:hypothetical protein
MKTLITVLALLTSMLVVDTVGAGAFRLIRNRGSVGTPVTTLI